MRTEGSKKQIKRESIRRIRLRTMEAAVRDIEACDRRRHVVVDADNPETENVRILHRKFSIFELLHQ